MSDLNIETLPTTLDEVETWWPKTLAAIMAEIRSPADPQTVAAQLRKQSDFMDLVRGWENMPTAAQARAWTMVKDRLWEAARGSRPFCLRCGECCRRGSPVLFPQDRPTLAAGIIRRADLLTLRSGEKAWSNRTNQLVTVTCEQVKIKEAPDGRTCIFLGPGGDACLVYDERPFQCRIMECWDPSRFDRLQGLPPLNRQELLGQDNPLAVLISRHEETCAISSVVARLQRAAAGDHLDQQAVLEAVVFDNHIRQFTAEKLNLSFEEMDFFFGRPLARIIRGYGYSFNGDFSQEAS